MDAKKIKKIVITLIIILVFVIGGLSFVAIKYSAKEIYTLPIDSINKYLNNNLDNITENITENTNLKINAKDNEKNTIIDNLEINSITELDLKNKIIFSKIESKYSDLNLFNIDSYFDNNNMYLYLKDVYDKYINVTLEKEMYNSIFDQLNNKEELKTIINGINNALKKSLDNKYFEIKNSKVIIDGQEVNVTNHILNLNESNLNKLCISFLTEINNNKEFISDFSKLINTDEESIKKSIADTLSELKNKHNLSTEVKMSITISTKGIFKEFVKFDINVLNSGNFEIIKTNKNNYSFEIKDFNSNSIVSGSFSKNNNVYNINLSNSKLGNLNISISNIINKNNNINKPDVSNNILFTEIDDEMETIKNKIFENDAMKKLIEDIQKYSLFSNNSEKNNNFEINENFSEYNSF